MEEENSVKLEELETKYLTPRQSSQTATAGLQQKCINVCSFAHRASSAVSVEVKVLGMDSVRLANVIAKCLGPALSLVRSQ